MDGSVARHAVVAGLASVVAVTVPTSAQATTGAGEALPYLNFALGCVTGAALTSAAALALVVRARWSEEKSMDVVTSRSVALGRGAQHLASKDAPNARHGRVPHARDRHRDHAPRQDSGRDIAVQRVADDDYADVAEGYLRLRAVTERVAVRAAGVRDTLMDRLGKDFFDDLPVIERADGSVGDVGAGWWDTHLGALDQRREEAEKAAGTSVAPATPPGNDAWSGEGDATLPFAGSAIDVAAFTTASLGPDVSGERNAADAPVAGVASTARSTYIARKVAEVEIGAFPERRSAEELDVSDTFAQALAAMDEHMGVRVGARASVPSFLNVRAPFADAVGDAATIDDPNGFEQTTNPLAFRVPSAHPLAGGGGSYVDYLLADELSSSSSRTVRSGISEYLRVVQGGAQDRPETRPAGDVMASASAVGDSSDRRFVPSYEAIAL